MYSYGPQHMVVQKQDDQHEHTFSNYVRIRDVVQKTCLRWWMMGKSGERGSEISVLPARHDDDDDDDDDIYIYECVCVCVKSGSIYGLKQFLESKECSLLQMTILFAFCTN